MFYVYILCCITGPERFYVGFTTDLKRRLQEHNAKKVPHTAQHAPWKLKTFVAFSERKQAQDFERYLKTASGRAFAKKRL